MKNLPQISEAEYEVMKIVWKHAPINTNEITGIFLVDPDGRTVEITGQIKDIAGEAFKNE